MAGGRNTDQQDQPGAGAAQAAGASALYGILFVFGFLAALWGASSTVSVLERAQELAAEERAFARAVARNESRISGLIDERREAGAALARAEEQLHLAARALEERQRTLIEAPTQVDLRDGPEPESPGYDMGDRNDALAMRKTELGLLELAAARDAIGAARLRAERAEGELAKVAHSLDRLTTEREAAEAQAAGLDALLRDVARRLADDESRSERALARLEGSAADGVLKLRDLFSRTGLDPDAILDQAAQSVEAVGGPFRPAPADLRAVLEADAAAGERFQALLSDLERFDLLAYAAKRIPLAQPVTETYRFSSGYGQRTDPHNRQPSMHLGLDLAAPKGTPVLATADGEVVQAGWREGYGKTVQIRHEFGLETVYAHLNQIRVEVGQQVRRGARIGDMGSTGRSTGSHLHYEIRHNEAALNPMKFIKAGRDVY